MEQQSCSQVYTDHHDEEFLQREKGIVVYQMCLLGFIYNFKFTPTIKFVPAAG